MATTYGVDESPRLKKHRAILRTFIKELCEHPDAQGVFDEPVDPVKHECPNYFDVIKHPMDLSTMDKKLLNTDCEYLRDPWKFIDDFNLMIANAIKFNKGTSSSILASKAESLAVYFHGNDKNKKRVDPVFMSIGMCCGTRHQRFRTRALACYAHPANGCHVARDNPYYLYKEKYSVCEECFLNAVKSASGSGFKPITIHRNQTDPASNDVKIYDTQNFVKMVKNDYEEDEPMVTCTGICKRRHHRICENWPENIFDTPFVCKACRKEALGDDQNTEPVLIRSKYNSKSLPINALSRFLEHRVRQTLYRQRCVEEANNTHIRVISTAFKECKVKEYMYQTYSNSNMYPKSFPYKSKAIFAFQEDPSDGSEVCFFGMHVNEYDHTCDGPNKKRVYISYLDSNFHFRPRKQKTKVYREIVLSYLEHAKKLGYRHGSIWSCPPSESDDYIFYAHPKEQKIPKSQRLLNWYKQLLDTAVYRAIVVEWNDLRKQATIDKINKITELPYFDGDFWPAEIERSIKELIQSQVEGGGNGGGRKKGRPSKSRSRCNSGASTSSVKSNKSGSKKKSRVRKTPAKKARLELSDADDSRPGTPTAPMTTSLSSLSICTPASVACDPVAGPSSAPDLPPSLGFSVEFDAEEGTKEEEPKFDDQLNQIILKKIEEQADVFFSLQLLAEDDPLYDADVHDPDPVLNCPLFDGREAFLTFCRTNFHEFSSLRRAKYSTRCMLKIIHETLTIQTGEMVDAMYHAVMHQRHVNNNFKLDNADEQKGGEITFKNCEEKRGLICSSLRNAFFSMPIHDPSMAMVKYWGDLMCVTEPGWTAEKLMFNLIYTYYGYHVKFCKSDTCTSSVCERTARFVEEKRRNSSSDDMEIDTSTNDGQDGVGIRVTASTSSLASAADVSKMALG